MIFRNKIRNLLFGKYEFNDTRFRDYCKYSKFPKIILFFNDFDVDDNVDDTSFITRNEEFIHFEWYKLQSMDPNINACFEELEVVPLLVRTLDKLLSKVKTGRVQESKYDIGNGIEIKVKCIYNTTRDKFTLKFKRYKDGDWVPIKYITDGPHCFYGEYLCPVYKLYCCVMHIIENVTLDINEMFVMYLITIYNHNEKFEMNKLCKILKKYKLQNMANEFGSRFDKFRL